MTERRWLFLGGALAGLFLFILYWTEFSPDPDPIRYDNFSQIEDGIQKAEVEQLLGCPPGNYRTGPVTPRIGDMKTHYKPIPPGTWAAWNGDQGNINVRFDAQNSVVYHYYVRGDKDPWPWSPFGYLERLLGYDW